MADLHIATDSYVVYRNNLINALRGMFSIEDILESDSNAKAIPSTWHTNSLTQLCLDAVKDTAAISGRVYLGTFSGFGLPTGMVSGKIMIEVSKGLSSKLLQLTIISQDSYAITWQQSYYMRHFTGWKTWSPTPGPGPYDEALYIKNGYLGVGPDAESVMVAGNYRESVERGTPMQFTDVPLDNYIWAIYPENCHPIIGMNLVQVPMQSEGTTTQGSTTYNIWRSNETLSGSFKLYFF